MYSYLPLGDSYTIGEAVEAHERWPTQLVYRLKTKDIHVSAPEFIAETGWTTDELQKAISYAKPPGIYDMVTLLIGVNNQYRGYPIGRYVLEFAQLLDRAIRFAGGEPANVFVVSIPDYGVTPFVGAKGLDPQKIAGDLDEYNRIAQRISQEKKASFTDITPVSKKAEDDQTLVASDGLHPSGKMYKQWVDEIFDTISSNFLKRSSTK